MTNIRIGNKKVRVTRRGDDQKQNWKLESESDEDGCGKVKVMRLAVEMTTSRRKVRQ